LRGLSSFGMNNKDVLASSLFFNYVQRTL